MIEANMHRRKRQVSTSWRMDETYIKVGGKDCYLYRALDKYGDTIDFLLTNRRMRELGHLTSEILRMWSVGNASI